MRKYWFPATSFCAGLLSMFLMYHFGILEQKKAPVPTKKTVVSQKVTTTTVVCVDRKHTVVPEDRVSGLWGVAKKEYGRGYLNLLIAEKNSKNYPSLAKNPNLIKLGWVLTIPCCLCDLPALTKPPVAKKVKVVTPKPKPPVKAVTPKSPCPACPKVVVQVVPPTSVAPAPPVKVSPPEAPKPPPAPKVQKQTQSQTVVNVAPPQAVVQPVVPTSKVEEPQVSVPVPAPKEPPKVFVPPAPSAKKVTEVIVPPTIKLSPPTHILVGSAWNSFGQNPIEPGNYVESFHVDQGYIIGHIGSFQIEPYVGLNATKDTKGYQWNNRVIGEAGLKVVRPFSHGVLEFGGAYAAERRFGANNLPSQTKMGPIGFSNGWFGWDQPTARESRRKFFTGATPGTVQWRVGNISPFERNNLIGVGRIDQGFTLAKIGRVSFIPTANLQMGFDTDRNPWNNRYTYGGGLKVAVPWKSGVLDFRGGYECAHQYAGVPVAGGSRCGPGFSVNIWTGWRHKKGGD